MIDCDKLPRSNVRNLPSCTLKKLRITEWIIENIKKQAIWGPFDPDNPLPDVLRNYRVSPLGAVKKGIHFNVPDELKKWRPIHHLSHPRTDVSVNSEVCSEWSTVQYVSFRQVVRMVQNLGPNALLWTVDAKDAYLRVPIKDECIKYMCFKWANKLFAFTSLSFGLASAPKIYTEFADAVFSIIKEKHPQIWKWRDLETAFHYIDDFFGGAPAHLADVAHQQFSDVIQGFAELGIPTKDSKCVAPSTRTKILGFIYDTKLQKIFIPEEKKSEILAEIDRLLHPGSTSSLRCDLQSLVGKLRWFSNCLWSGAAFVRRLEQAINRKVNGQHRCWIKNSSIRADLRWWRRAILLSEDGISFENILRDPAGGDIHVLTDAATHFGLGGWTRTGQWYRYMWNSHKTKAIFADPSYPDIYWKEMCAIAVACVLWSSSWKDKAVTFWCDNMSCVYSLAKRSCTFDRPDIMALIRVIAESATRFKFSPFIIHIKGKDNITADALSRFDLTKFHHDTAGIEMNSWPSRSEAQISEIVLELARVSGLKSLI